QHGGVFAREFPCPVGNNESLVLQRFALLFRCDLHRADQGPTAGIRADHFYVTGCIAEVVSAKGGQQSSELVSEIMEDGPSCSSSTRRVVRRKQNAPGIGGVPSNPGAVDPVGSFALVVVEARYAQSTGYEPHPDQGDAEQFQRRTLFCRW